MSVRAIGAWISLLGLAAAFSSTSLARSNDCSDALRTPVSSISLVIPAYRELKNGNIKNFLDSLSDQEIPGEQLNIAIVVNNNEKIAADPTSEVFIENQQTLQWLNSVIEEETYPYNILVLDLSTKGTERNMGKIRQQGVEFLSENLSGDPKNQILVHMDSDTRFEPGFLARLKNRYENDSAVEAVFFQRRYELRGTPQTAMLQSHPSYALRRSLRDLKVILSGYHEGFATYQISSRLSAMKDIGGFKPLAAGEDTQLSKDLVVREHLLDPDLTVRTEDRSRPDGFTGADRFQALQGGVKNRTTFPILRVVFEHLAGNLSRKVESREITLQRGLTLFKEKVQEISGEVLDPDSIPTDSKNPVFAAFEKSLKRSSSATIGKDLVDLIFRNIPAQEQSVLNEIIDDHFDQLKDKMRLRSRYLDLLLSQETDGKSISQDPFISWARWDNPSFQEYLEAYKLNTNEPEKIRKQIEADFSEWLSTDFANSSVQYIYVQALLEFLSRARLTSTTPQTARLLKGLTLESESSLTWPASLRDSA